MKTGYIEIAKFNADGLRIAGWAADKNTGRPATYVRLSSGTLTSHEIELNVLRPDVQGAIPGVELMCGFDTVIPFDLNSHDEWIEPVIGASWEDGESIALAQIRSENSNDLYLLTFSEFDEFQAHFQNPATRLDNPQVQALAAHRALTLATPLTNYWMSAAVLAIYRCIQGNFFAVEHVKKIIYIWDSGRNVNLKIVHGEDLRWIISMHLAVGYAHLSWGDIVSADVQFSQIKAYEQHLQMWPQAHANMLIARFLSAWLSWRRGNRAVALQCLDESVKLFHDGVRNIAFWSWYHFEELRVTLNICQQCFTLARRIEGEDGYMTWPPEAEKTVRLAGLGSGNNLWMRTIHPRCADLSLRIISSVLAGMIEDGRIKDGPFPTKPA